jgi:cytochrome c oxidase subunit 1
VHALDEFFHRKYEENEATGEVTKVATAEEILAEQEAHADTHIHMPSPSYWPIVLAAGLPVMAYGVIFERLLIAVGGIIVLLAAFAWTLEPSVADEDDYDPPSSDDGPTKELATIG